MASKFLPSLLFSVLFISTSTAFDGDIHDFFLPNGLKVILMERHGAPKVAVNIAYNVGSHDELIGKKGINDIVTKAIVLEGTELYPTEKIAKKRDEYKAGYGDGGAYDMSYFWTEIPIDGLEFVLDLESDRMINVKINDDVLIKMKERYHVDWEEWKKDEASIAFKNAFKVFMPEGHAYQTHYKGIPDQVDSLTVQSCQSWYKSYFSPNNAVLVIVGDFDPKEITKLVYTYFSSIPSVDEIPPDPSLSIEGMDTTPSIFKDSINSEWFTFPGGFIGSLFFMPSAREDDAVILGHIENIIELSISKRDNLFKRLSKNRKLFINADSDYLSLLGYSGFFIYSFNVFRTGSINKINKQVLSTFKYIGDNGIDNKLLEQYKRLEFLEEYEEYYSYNLIARRLVRAELILGDYKYYNRKIELLKELSNDDIMRVVTKYFDNDNMKTIVVSINDNKRTWYTPMVSFFANQIVLRLWDPDK